MTAAYLVRAPGVILPKTITAIENFVRSSFPVRSDEFEDGTTKRREFLNCLERLLDALVVSGNSDFLQVLWQYILFINHIKCYIQATLFLAQVVLNSVCRDKEAHIHELYIQESLRGFIKNPTTNALIALNKTFDMFQADTLPVPFRAAVAQRSLPTLLKSASYGDILKFYTQHAPELCAIVLEKLKADSSPELFGQLLLKSSVFVLLEVMYIVLQINDLHAPGAKVNSAYCEAMRIQPSDRGNDLTKLLCGGSGLFGALTETHLTSVSDSLTELRRLYHCNAYNALAALISCTQKEEKFFSTFLFKENPQKAERLLDNIVDLKMFEPLLLTLN